MAGLGSWPGPFKSIRQMFRSHFTDRKPNGFRAGKWLAREGVARVKIDSPGNRAIGYRNPPKPDIGSCSGAEHEFTAIWQPSCTQVRHIARLNFFLFPERFVAFSKMQEP